MYLYFCFVIHTYLQLKVRLHSIYYSVFTLDVVIALRMIYPVILAREGRRNPEWAMLHHPPPFPTSQSTALACSLYSLQPKRPRAPPDYSPPSPAERSRYLPSEHPQILEVIRILRPRHVLCHTRHCV